MINSQGDIINDLHTNCIDFKSREIYLHNYFGSADTENPGVEYKMSNIFFNMFFIYSHAKSHAERGSDKK